MRTPLSFSQTFTGFSIILPISAFKGINFNRSNMLNVRKYIKGTRIAQTVARLDSDYV